MIFAGVLLVLLGSLNVIDGVAAIGNAHSMSPTRTTCSPTSNVGLDRSDSRDPQIARRVWRVGRKPGLRISDGFISPLELVEIGLHSAEEAEALHALETAAQND